MLPSNTLIAYSRLFSVCSTSVASSSVCFRAAQVQSIVVNTERANAKTNECNYNDNYYKYYPYGFCVKQLNNRAAGLARK